MSQCNCGALLAANAFWSLWIRASRKSRRELQSGSFQQRRKQSCRPWNRQQVITKAKIQEWASPSGGSAKSDTGSWQTKRASSDQSGQGGSAATNHHHETRQASGIEIKPSIVDRQTERHVGAHAQNVHQARPASSGDRSVRLVQSPEKLRSKCSALRFTRGARCIKPGTSFTRRSCTQERNCRTGLHPEDHK